MPYHDSYLWKLRQKVGSELLLIPGASVLVENNKGEILLTKRSDSNIWCMPGGSAEVGSSFLLTAIQELREEVGIFVEPKELIAFACISAPEIHLLTYSNGDQVHAFALWFALQKWCGEPKIGDEVQEVCFFDISSFPSNTLKPSQVALKLYMQFKETGKFQVL
jgi:8-oxo-dGTP pyrophosphatase MutT (NUDIX family)